MYLWLLQALGAPRGAEGPEGAFGRPRAQLRWALGHNENKNLFSLASRPARRLKARSDPQLELPESLKILAFML